MNKSILVIDDDAAMCALVEDMLSPRGFDVVAGDHRADVLPQLDGSGAAVLLTDLRIPRVDGLSLCRRVADARPDVPVVVMTGFGSLENAVEAIRAGAYDFVTKPVDAASLALVLERAVSYHALRNELRILRAGGEAGAGEGLVGKSAAVSAVRDVIRQVADLDVTVLVTGPSGSGKEVVARSLHLSSSRKARPFIAVNCAALPEHLLESQLFGHVRGAFTDARNDHAGLLQQASGGTLFLDEIGEMPLSLQPKLLRVLEERSVRPVGGDREIPVDVRFVVATNRDLEACVAEATFREDLYYRVNVVHLELPPLRARGEDVLLLAQLFLERAARRMRRPVSGIAPAAAAVLLGYPWPGNVRELQNAIERAVALTKYEEIVVADLPEKVLARPAPAAVDVDLVSLDEVERRHVLGVLEKVGWNRRRAAGVLGVDPKTLYRKLLAWGAEPGKAS